ncbi:MAG: PIN domain-containing protein [Halobacteria archaeon]
MNRYYYDSWAILEFFGGNPRFEPYFAGVPGATSAWNLAEVYFKLIQAGHPVEDARRKCLRFQSHLLTFGPRTVFRAMEFRRDHPDPERAGRYLFSYADALGYALALERGLTFLTGDRDFQGLPKVEYLR